MAKTTVAMVVTQIENMAATIDRLEGRIIELEQAALQAPVAQPSNGAALAAAQKLMALNPEHCSGVFIPKNFEMMSINRQRFIYTKMQTQIGANRAAA